MVAVVLALVGCHFACSGSDSHPVGQDAHLVLSGQDVLVTHSGSGDARIDGAAPDLDVLAHDLSDGDLGAALDDLAEIEATVEVEVVVEDMSEGEMEPQDIAPPPEICNGLDDDGDGAVDEGFPDNDLDGLKDCVDPDDDNDGDPDFTDCQPLDAGFYWGAIETCNGLDDDCDGVVDEELFGYDCGEPKITSAPEASFDVGEALGCEFDLDVLFISSSRTDEVRVYDAESLDFLQTFTHPLFSEVASPLFTYGPNGMAFNERRNLVVAAYSSFVEFVDYGVEYKVYPKVTSEANENVLFDSVGNLYTTTSTGGSDKLNQYRAEDYAFEMTIEMPPGAGQLTGITFDYYSRIFVASQSDSTIHVAEASPDFSEFEWVGTLSGAGNPKKLEGLQISPNGEVLAASGDIIRYDFFSGEKLGSFDAPNDLFPVPLTVDNWGRVYTADYENGSGTAPADIFRFSPEGELETWTNDPGLLGPFGLVISGTVLPGDPPLLYSYQVVAEDIDGEELSFSLTKHPPGMFIGSNSGLIEWLITSAQRGLYEVAVKVEDPAGNSDLQEFVLEVK